MKCQSMVQKRVFLCCFGLHVISCFLVGSTSSGAQNLVSNVKAAQSSESESTSPHLTSEIVKPSLIRNRRSDVFSENGPLYGSDADLNSAFLYNDQIMQNLLSSPPSKPLSYARSNLFLNYLKPRTTRYNAWDDHSLMHFGKRSLESDIKNEKLLVKRSTELWSPNNVLHFGKKSENSVKNYESQQKPFDIETDDFESDTSVNSKNPDISYSNAESDYPQNDNTKKSADPWHSRMSFGKKSQNPWDYNTMHFGKREEPWHSMMSFGKRFQNLWDHNTLHFGKRDPWDHNTLHFGKRDPWDHSTLHFGKRDPWDHSTLHFGKRNPWEHNTLHFGKRDEPWHNMMSFGKRADNLWDHDTLHFGKKGDPWHNMMSFGKKSEIADMTDLEKRNDPWHNMMSFGKKSDGLLNNSFTMVDKRDEPWHSMMSFGKKAEFGFDHSTLHFGKKDEPWHNMMSFGKKSENPWDHNTLHFGKKDEPWHNMMSFGKKSDPLSEKFNSLFESADHPSNTIRNAEKKAGGLMDDLSEDFSSDSDPWYEYDGMMFYKKSQPWDHNTLHFGKKSNVTWELEPATEQSNSNHVKKRSIDVWDNHNTMHFGKKLDPWDSHNKMQFGEISDSLENHNVNNFEKKDYDGLNNLENIEKKFDWDSHNTMHFGKRDPEDYRNTFLFEKKDPWESHNTMHFGKRDPWDSHNTMHFGKRDPWDSHNTMHFGKRDPWESHNTMHFGKRDPWDSHNTMHFGKRDPWDSHNTMHFGKRDPWDSHNTMHFGKRDPWDSHSTMHFGKRDPWDSHNTMHFGKREPWDSHNTMHFGKRDPWDSHNTMHFGKRSEPSLKDESTFNQDKSVNQNVVKAINMENTKDKIVSKSDKKESDIKKRSPDDPKSKNNAVLNEKPGKVNDNLNFFHESKAIKQSLKSSENAISPKSKQNLNSGINKNLIVKDHVSTSQVSDEKAHIQKRSVNPNSFVRNFNDDFNKNIDMVDKYSDDGIADSVLHFGKRSVDEADENENQWLNGGNEKRFDDFWNDHNTLHFGKKSDPWDNYNTLHFGKRSNSQELYSVLPYSERNAWKYLSPLHVGKKFDPWEGHAKMHFGKRTGNWDHNVMHFGKRKEFTPDESEVLSTLDIDPIKLSNYLQSLDDEENESTENKNFLDNFVVLKSIINSRLKDDNIPLNERINLLRQYIKPVLKAIIDAEESKFIPYMEPNDNSNDRTKGYSNNEEDILGESSIIPFQVKDWSKYEQAILKQGNDDSSYGEYGDKKANLYPNESENLRKSKRKYLAKPELKRYFIPFQGPKSIVYPHAWFASQIRRSSLPRTKEYARRMEMRMAEKKEDPFNSYMHFGRR